MQENYEDFILVRNINGATLGYSPKSGVRIITDKGFKFKDLNKNGVLDPYEDWRLSIDERARDLASKMTVEQIAGLMLYSAHQSIPGQGTGFGAATYNGRSFSEGNIPAWSLSDAQRSFLMNDNVRHVLITSVESPEVAARWNNQMQEFVEGIGLGIPGNTSSDPRHSGQISNTVAAEFNAGAGGVISVWPDGLGMAATFDPAVVKQFGEIASKEYRALGIGTALSPQIDLGTEPRWYRIYMTFGESPELSRDMARAYIDGFQTSTGDPEIKDGWGFESVNAMVKHWPGGGTGEAGRDAHWAFGKFGVYPGNNFDTHLIPFTEGALKLEGPTQQASAVMPYYTISYNQAPDSTNYANGFSKYMVTDLLREKYGYDGVLCTDWMITADEGASPADFNGKPWGVEAMTVAQRHYIALMAGMDQFGGNNEMGPVMEAYHMGVNEHGEEFMRNRFEESAVRLLKNIFRLGLFENPYLNPERSMEIVGNPEFMQAGYEAQLKSVVMLKNKSNVLPVREKKKVYIPEMYYPSIRDWWGNTSEASTAFPVNKDLLGNYYELTTDPQKADFAIVFVSSPHVNADGGGYDKNDRAQGNNGYVPISLQYRPYTATEGREQSIAAGDPVVDPTITNRSYNEKTTTVSNFRDLDIILSTRKVMPDKPIIVVVNMNRPMVFNEFKDQVDGILVRFGVGEQAVLDIISGKYEPSGLLPLQMPADMAAVERQSEDVPFDMECHTDSQGNVYDFAFGLNWSGVIQDSRTEKYKRN
ncbi:MAG: glycoside hydrolase family 3 C-terminal domain-containing protein [Bacteroidales bacterium]|nr:glycoside hydrolase family 3 C-terminal domain-containing protein [Bacteroidales bacterium]